MKIRELFSDRSKWTKGFYARTIYGEQTFAVGSNSLNPICFCLLGAVQKCYFNLETYDSTEVERVTDLLEKELGNIAKWNDAPERTFEEVKALVEKLDI